MTGYVVDVEFQCARECIVSVLAYRIENEKSSSIFIANYIRHQENASIDQNFI